MTRLTPTSTVPTKDVDGLRGFGIAFDEKDLGATTREMPDIAREAVERRARKVLSEIARQRSVREYQSDLEVLRRAQEILLRRRS
jgi:hypothetical protein